MIGYYTYLRIHYTKKKWTIKLRFSVFVRKFNTILFTVYSITTTIILVIIITITDRILLFISYLRCQNDHNHH